MSLHKDPVTPAEKLARHLEDNYGLQLDPARHAGLLKDLEEFLPKDANVRGGSTTQRTPSAEEAAYKPPALPYMSLPPGRDRIRDQDRFNPPDPDMESDSPASEGDASAEG